MEYDNEFISEYNRKTTDYGNGMVEIVKYYEPKYRIKGFTRGKQNSRVPEISDEAQEIRTKNQVFAIRRKIKGYAFANMESFKWFVTFTLDPKKTDRMDYEDSKSKLLKWCRLMRDRYGKFDYIIVPELHKSGAVHFHALLGDIPAQFIKAVHPSSNLPLLRNDRQIYNLQDWEYGFSDCELISEPLKVSSYITKYVTKSLINDKTMYQKKRYFVNKGLAKPEVSFEMADNKDLDKLIPNYGIVKTDLDGNNVIALGIYKLEICNDTGLLEQVDSEYTIKAKAEME